MSQNQDLICNLNFYFVLLKKKFGLYFCSVASKLKAFFFSSCESLKQFCLLIIKKCNIISGLDLSSTIDFYICNFFNTSGDKLIVTIDMLFQALLNRVLCSYSSHSLRDGVNISKLFWEPNSLYIGIFWVFVLFNPTIQQNINYLSQPDVIFTFRCLALNLHVLKYYFIVVYLN